MATAEGMNTEQLLEKLQRLFPREVTELPFDEQIVKAKEVFRQFTIEERGRLIEYIAKDLARMAPKAFEAIGRLIEEKRSTGLEDEGLAVSVDPIDFEDSKLGKLIKGYQKRGGPRFHWWNNPKSSAYVPLTDVVQLTERQLLNVAKTGLSSEELFHRVIAHEMIHSTGHASRLRRDHIARMQEDVDGVKVSQREIHLEEIIADRGLQIVLGHLGLLTPAIKAQTDKYIAEYAKAFEEAEDMTLGEVRLEAEPFAVAAAEHVIGKKLQRKVKKSPIERELVGA